MSALKKIYNESVLLGIDVSSLSSLREKLSDELKPQVIETSIETVGAYFTIRNLNK